MSHSHSHSTKFQDLWSKSNSVAYSSDTPVSTIMDFISVLDKKKEDWTKTVEARNLLNNTFIALSKTSPEVFGGYWKRTGKLPPSPLASLWTATIKVLGCSFGLNIQIKLTANRILKSNIKDLKIEGKKLTFDVASVSVNTKEGRFLTGKVPCQPFAKKIRVEKQFSRKHQTYIQVTVSGNIYGVKKYDHFVKEFREMIGVVMSFEPSLVVIPYPGGDESHKGRSFVQEPSTLVSS